MSIKIRLCQIKIDFIQANSMNRGNVFSHLSKYLIKHFSECIIINFYIFYRLEYYIQQYINPGVETPYKEL